MEHIFLKTTLVTILSFYLSCVAAQTGVTKYGTSVLTANTVSGIYNSGFGYYSLNANTTGFKNTGVGANTLRFNLGGNYNTATGYAAMYKNESGNENAGYGHYALFSNLSGSFNTALGTYSLQANVQGSGNTAIGNRSLYVSNAPLNTAVGYYTLTSNTTGSDNTGNGAQALYSNTTGGQNTASGVYAMMLNQNGSFNTASGFTAMDGNRTGSYNTAIGNAALHTNQTGSNNTAIGSAADVSLDGLSNATAIGYQAIVDRSNKVRIGNTAVTSIGGQVGWTIFSDGRYKKDIAENIPGLAFINSLRPVSYTLNVKGLNEYYTRNQKKAVGNDSINGVTQESNSIAERAVDKSSTISYSGFVAQEVEAAAKKLNFEFSGVDKPSTADGLYGLRYDNFVAPLVKAVQELSQQNSDLKKEMAELRTMIQTATSSTVIKNQLSLNDASLEQNNPNPFTGSTTIRYNLPLRYTAAKIVVTDNSGRTIKEINLINKGTGSVRIDTNSLSSGTYYYSFYVDQKLIGTKQMLLVK